jgi:transcriptional regulator with XRE-family HTH domain
MDYAIEPITSALKVARQRKGLSQRELGSRVGVPQSHISKIESGAVDLQTSSLLEIARGLDLELMLVPRALVPTVQSLQRSTDTDRPRNVETAKTEKELKNLTSALQSIKHIPIPVLPVAEIKKTLDALQPSLNALKSASKEYEQLRQNLAMPEIKAQLQQIAEVGRTLASIRNNVVHGNLTKPSAPIPAYRPDMEDDDA